MGAKQSRLSPAKQREADMAAIAQPKKAPAQPEWADWESKLDRISGRDMSEILHGWMAHIPEIEPAGAPPREGVSSIATIDDLLPQVPKRGDLVESLSGARSAVLHEAIYLLHKAIHVQILCAKGIVEGRHTWAVVDAYQASLFALSSVMSFLGITVERSGGDFILIDVWEPGASKKSTVSAPGEQYKFIRFKTLDHFHKWAILKRVLRTLKSPSPLGGFLLESINDLDIKSFANHRNTVHYQTTGWIAEDLLEDDKAGPIIPAKNPQELHEGIFNGTESGTVFLMCALVEFACEFVEDLINRGVLANERVLLDRRTTARNTITSFDWNEVGKSQAISS